MTSPGLVVLLVAHVVSAFVGFGALGATGAFRRACRRSKHPFQQATLRSFFRPGHNLAARTLYLVPVFGLVLDVFGSSEVAGRAYPYIGLALWAAALGVAHGLIWPEEARIQELFTTATGENGREQLERSCRRIEYGSAATTVLFVAAFAVMIVQP